MNSISTNQTRNHVRSGITKTELIVVLLIISITIALIIPAVQYSRSGSREQTCQFQLQRLTTGMLAFAEINDGRLPASTMTFDGADEASWVVDPGIPRIRPT